MRLFLAAPVPATERYAQVSNLLRDYARHARLVPAGSWHVTLRFLGEADPAAVVAAVEPVLRDTTAIPVVVQGVGAFPNARHARVAWLGMMEGGLAPLAEKLRAALPVRREEPHPFRAHATLARIDPPTDLTRFVAEHANDFFAEGWFDEVVLMRSDLKPAGPVYSPVKRFRLERPGPPEDARPKPFYPPEPRTFRAHGAGGAPPKA